MKNNPRTLNGWAMYDWANSVFNLTIATAIFPIFYGIITKRAAINLPLEDDKPVIIKLLGLEVVNTAAYSFTFSLAFLAVVLISPVLSGIADYGGLKKRMMQFFVLLGATSCALLYFANENNIGLTLFFLLLGTIGFGGSLVFYNSFLPEICTEDRMNKVSAKGFALGYIGSVLLLIINLVVIQKPEWFFDLQGKVEELLKASPLLTADDALTSATDYYKFIGLKLSFLAVGIWWLGFSQITFATLPKEVKTGPINKSILSKGIIELKKVWSEVKQNSTIKTYIFGFFFASMGVQTVMYLASLFADNELHMASDRLILVLLIIQLVGALGALFFSWLAKIYGNLPVLILALIFWIGVCISGYLVQTEFQFYFLASAVGIVMGGTQSMLRSTYAKLVPEDTTNNASYFSFYDVTEKFSTVLGTFAFGLINQLTGNMRLSALALGLFFIIGLVFLFNLKKQNSF